MSKIRGFDPGRIFHLPSRSQLCQRERQLSVRPGHVRPDAREETRSEGVPPKTMPFPYAKVPYGHLRRLRELATPVEVYDLQLAVGNKLDGLLPLQLTKNVFKIGIEENDDSAVNVYETNYDAEYTILATDVVYIVARMYIDLKVNKCCEMLYLKNTFELTIDNDCLTLDHLRLFARQMPNITQLFIYSALQNVTLFDVLTKFSKLRILHTKTIYHGWMHDLVEAHADNMKMSFDGEDITFDDVFSFNPEDLLQLLNKKCEISVKWENSFNETFDAQIEKISAYLGPSFTINTTSISLPFFMVELHHLAYPDTPAASSRMLLKHFVSRDLLEARGK